MSDASLNRFLASGTNAERLAYTPVPPTPASGPDPTYIWFETDTGDTFAWDADGAAWGQVNSSPGSAVWGAIGGTLSDQTDLQGELDAKANVTDIGTAGALDIDTDGTLAANSDTLLATQKAVKTYVATAVTGLLDFKGSTDASSNPNYPSASKGDCYVISVAGKVGGGSGASVDAGDVMFATADNAGGTQASVGTSWAIIEHNGVYGGSVSFAVASDINTGSDTIKALNSDALAGSVFGTKTVEVLLSDPGGSAVTTGDGKAYFRVTSDLNGMNLIACGAVLDTAGTGGGYLMQLRRKRSGSDQDMLSTRISIDSGENDSADATTAPVINTSYDDVQTGDRIYFDRDGVPTGGKGDSVWMQFQLP